MIVRGKINLFRKFKSDKSAIFFLFNQSGHGVDKRPPRFSK